MFLVSIPSGEINLPKDSKVKCDQMRTIDISRIANKIADLSSEFVYAIEIAMNIHLGL